MSCTYVKKRPACNFTQITNIFAVSGKIKSMSGTRRILTKRQLSERLFGQYTLYPMTATHEYKIYGVILKTFS